MRLLIMTAALTLLVHGAQAAERCMVRANKPTGAIEDPAAVMKAGTNFGPITQVRINKNSGQVSYCAHGSYCYPSTWLSFVSPCRIPSFSDDTIGDERYYYPR